MGANLSVTKIITVLVQILTNISAVFSPSLSVELRRLVNVHFENRIENRINIESGGFVVAFIAVISVICQFLIAIVALIFLKPNSFSDLLSFSTLENFMPSQKIIILFVTLLVLYKIGNMDLTQKTPIGTILPFAGRNIPNGWLLCDGREINRAQYANLYSVIDITYGLGNGNDTFNLPDLRGRTVIGVGQGNGLTDRVLGHRLGEETHLLTIDELPTHNHSGTTQGETSRIYYDFPSYLWNFVYNQNRRMVSDMGAPGGQHTFTTNNVGGNNSHNIMPPSLVLKFIIKF